MRPGSPAIIAAAASVLLLGLAVLILGRALDASRPDEQRAAIVREVLRLHGLRALEHVEDGERERALAALAELEARVGVRAFLDLEGGRRLDVGVLAPRAAEELARLAWEAGGAELTSKDASELVALPLVSARGSRCVVVAELPVPLGSSALALSLLGLVPLLAAAAAVLLARQATRRATLLRAERRLLRDASHELRSPLTRIQVTLELARPHATPIAAPLLDRIERETERLRELIDDLLTFVRLEEGHAPPPPERVDLAALALEVVRDADFEARGRGCRASMAAADAAHVSGSAELLRRALENVVRNAVRFTRLGTTVEVRLERRGEGGRREVELEVRDQGPGVPAAALREIFRPFSRVETFEARRADDRTRDRRLCAGVGLAIAEHAVSLHGGRIRAENAPEGGLRVVLTLPDEDALAR